MTITEAQNKIDEKRRAGLISVAEARWFEKKVRRDGDYGNKWSGKRRSEMRDNLLKDF